MKRWNVGRVPESNLELRRSRPTGRVVGRIGGTLAVSLLLTTTLLAAVAAGGSVGPRSTLKAPYNGSIGVAHEISDLNGCATTRILPPKWVATSGADSQGDYTAAKACRAAAGIGGSGNSYVQTSDVVAVPFHIGSNGNHSVRSSWTVTLAGVFSYTQGGCPSKHVNFNPPLYTSSSAECFSQTFISFGVSAHVVDLSNSSWSNSNFSFFQVYNNSEWQNTTVCSNYGTPSCYNSTGGMSFNGNFGYNEVGAAAFGWNKSTTVSFWTNSTAMQKADKFALVYGIFVSVSSEADGINLLAIWPGSAKASINLATAGNGAMLNSATVT